MGGHHTFGAFGVLHWAGSVLSIIFVIIAAYIIHRFFSGRKQPNNAPDHLFIGRKSPRNTPDHRDSLDILKTRLASGDLSQEEYDKLKKVLLG